ncbi:MAG: hypothetical protein GY898_27795 [Proteobacteria bacterium]|nr:hypothetical protein [Pseudomonadota bacterium]
MTRTLIVLLGGLLLVGCEPEVETITDLPNVAGGNPLVPDVAMYPWPSDLYLEADASTRTGRRVVLPEEPMPPGLSTSTFADDDGFTRIPAMLAWFREGVDPASLPDAADAGATTRDDSPIFLVEEGTWRRIPLLVEPDLNARGPFEQALILRPNHVLAPDTGYAVLIRDGIKGTDGADIRTVEAFRALRDGVATDSDAVEAQRADWDAIGQGAIDALGLDPAELILGWTFHTRSEEQVTRPLLAMQEVMAAVDLPPAVITSQAQDDDNWVVRGTFETPYFLTDDHALVLDADGLPVQQGTRGIEFVLAVPDTVEETRPLICYGHGFFSNKEQVAGGSFNDLLQEREFSGIALDFRGFAEQDIADTVPILSGDLDAVPTITNRQNQNVANFTLMARLVREQLAGLIELDRGEGTFAPIDPDAIHYMGISNGGTQGLTIMTTSSFFERGVLVVPGGGWSHMLQRAVQWTLMATVLEETYEPLDLQLAMSMMQNILDRADSLNYVEHLTTDRWDGRTNVAVTLHEAIDDAQVSNMVTEWVARSADVPVITPSPEVAWGLEEVTAAEPDGFDGPSAMYVYDLHVEPPPDGNVPPETDGGSHGAVRDLPVYVEHVGRFLEDGSIVQVCDGPCDPQ